MKKFFTKTKKTVILAVVVVLVIAAYGIAANKTSSKRVAEASLGPKVEAQPKEIDPKIKEFGLKIDKLNILAPVIKDVDGNDKTAYNKALINGVAHFKGTALPGEKGNIFIFGHSSAEINKGDYTKIFAPLNDLGEGDEIIVFYKNNELKYKVEEKKIVAATDLSVLKKTKTETLTLMTCWPVGTKDKRLVIRATPE